jgi:hypothetical protein
MELTGTRRLASLESPVARSSSVLDADRAGRGGGLRSIGGVAAHPLNEPCGSDSAVIAKRGSGGDF